LEVKKLKLKAGKLKDGRNRSSKEKKFKLCD
jgi:hypothetical protein